MVLNTQVMLQYAKPIDRLMTFINLKGYVWKGEAVNVWYTCKQTESSDNNIAKSAWYLCTVLSVLYSKCLLPETLNLKALYECLQRWISNKSLQ